MPMHSTDSSATSRAWLPQDLKVQSLAVLGRKLGFLV